MKSLMANLALSLAAVLVVIGVTELSLRVFPRLMPPAAALRVHWVRQATPVTRGDPDIGFLYPANYEGQGGAGEAAFRFTTDENGFRNPSPWPSSADIVIVGDSYVFGYGVAEELGWTHLLARSLPNTRVINLGLPGTAPRQYQRVYERFGVPLHPKLLMFGLFPGNDLQDQREFDRWLDAGSPENFGTWKFVHGRPPGPVRTLLEHTYLYWVLRQTVGRLEWPSPKPMTFPDGSRIRFVPSLLRTPADMASPDNPTFKRVLEIIEETRGVAHENGTELLVLLFPTKEGVYLPLRGESVPNLMPAFTSQLETRGIRYLDLTVPMREEGQKGKRLFFEVDGHPDSAGYRVIADAVLANLHQNAGTYHLSDGQ